MKLHTLMQNDFSKFCKEDISKVAKVGERRLKFNQDQFTNVMKNSYTKKNQFR